MSAARGEPGADPRAAAGTARARPQIGVIGASRASAEEQVLAEAVGRELARRDAVLICGGGGGVMAAACAGARAGGGLTVGLLPGSDRRRANPDVAIAIPTGMGDLRNGLIVRASDALVAIGGEWGTLSEIALALTAGCPVVGLASWDLDRPGRPPGPEPATDPVAAVERALALAGHG